MNVLKPASSIGPDWFLMRLVRSACVSHEWLSEFATFGLMTPDVTDPIHGQVVTGFQQRAAEQTAATHGTEDKVEVSRILHEFDGRLVG